jgi:mannose-6-phosphate isomerase-like protein (cupin superfamily)
MSHKRFVKLAAGEGRPTRIDMEPFYFVKAGEEDTEGRFSLLEVYVKHDVPLHIHNSADESFFLMEGTMDVTFGDEVHRVEQGGFMLLPYGVPHAVKRVGSVVPRLLQVSSPGGFEHFAQDLLELQEQGAAMDLQSQEFADFAAKHDWTLLAGR